MGVCPTISPHSSYDCLSVLLVINVMFETLFFFVDSTIFSITVTNGVYMSLPVLCDPQFDMLFSPFVIARLPLAHDFWSVFC